MNIAKKISAAVAAFAATAALAAICACNSGNATKVENNADSYSHVFTVSSSVMDLTDSTSVYDYLCALQEDGEITFEGYDSSYGYYITSVNGVAEQTGTNSGYSWMLYTDLAELDGVTYSSADYGSWEYDGKTLNSASYGISYLPAVEGYTYALVYSYWSY